MPKPSTHSFKLWNFAPPAKLLDPNNMTSFLVNTLLKEEDIARQRSLLDNSIFAELRQVCDASRDEDQVQNLLFDNVALGRYIGPHLSKYAQTTQEKVNMHTYPSGTTVMKAFVANDFTFYNTCNCDELPESSQRAPISKP
jgi:hypothetical protein